MAIDKAGPSLSFGLPKSKIEELIKVVAWYAAQPDGPELGDRFHENISDYFSDSVPDDYMQEITADDDWFWNRFDLKDGKLIGVLQSAEADGTEKEVTIVEIDD